MAETVGGTVPVPAKRPTIIRDKVNTDGGLPTRPTPPVPGHRPPPPAAHRNNGESPASRPPPLPSRPSTALPPTPVRPPERPASVSIDSVRRRPEITIVSARPMSEVGFRDGATTPPTVNNSGADQPSLMAKPSRPQVPSPNVPPTPKRPVPPSNKSDIEMLINFDNSPDEQVKPPISRPSLHRPLPAVPGRPSVTPLMPDNESHTDVPPDRSHPPPRGTPPPLPNHPPLSPHGPLDESHSTHSVPPPAPRQSSKPPGVPPSRPHKVPSPVFKNLTDNVAFATNSSVSNRHIDNENTNDNASLDCESCTQNTDSPDALYAVINKPKRPTIIRPGKPSLLSGEASDSRRVVDETDVKKPFVPPVPRRTADASDIEEMDITSNIVNKVPAHSLPSTNKQLKELREPSTETNGDSFPEFLKLRLKTTVVDPDSATDHVHAASSTAGSGATEDKVGDIQPATKSPPTAMKPKPKPAVKPKPKLAAKPTVAPIVNNKGSYVKNIGNFLTHKEQTDEIDDENVGKSTHGRIEDLKNHLKEVTEPNKHAVTSDESKHVDAKDDREPGKPIKPPGFKRPTIIRAGRNVQSEDSGETNETGLSKNPNLFTESVDDSALQKQGSHQPPLPSQRPVSMVNIPSHVTREDRTHMSASQSLDLATESANLRPKSRPVARGRPASVAVPNLRPAPPFSQHKPGTSFPPRPQQRPPPRLSPPSANSQRTSLSSPDNDRDHSESPEPRLAHRPKIIGVSVLPMPTRGGDSVFGRGDKTSERSAEQNLDTRPPEKPGRRPPPPKMSSQEEEKSSDEEFMSALDKPSRPAPPAIKTSPELKPSRPSGPPTQRKASLNLSNTDAETVQVKMRPSRLEGKPSRPTSMPVKVEEPVHARPPRPAQTKGKTKGGAQHLPPRPGPGHPLYHYMMQVPHGIALYDYTASQEDELTFKEGDMITLVRGLDDEWIIGRLGEEEGMFPRGFIKVKMPLPGEMLDDESSESESESEMFYDAMSEKPDTLGHGPRCRARFDFEGQGPDDLTFEEGDVFRLVERVGLEWRKGEINGHVGLFPLSFVELIEDLPPDGSTENTSCVVTALFDFDGEPHELNFSKGQTITVQYRVDEEWLYGECGGRGGQFPIQFIDHVPPDLPPYPAGRESNMAAEGLTPGAMSWGDDIQDAQPKSTPVEPSHCVALFDFPGEVDRDLGFVTGDRIEILERVGADWLKGRLHSRTGMFPAAFVEIKEVDSHSNTGPCLREFDGDKKVYGWVEHDFDGEADNELTLRAGERLEVLEEVTGAEGWQWGMLNERKGIFPTAFVTLES